MARPDPEKLRKRRRGAPGKRTVRRAPLAWLLLSLLSFGIGPAFSLDRDRPLSQLVLDGWTTGQGLPQNTVTSILQTGDGYLWVGTYEGLARFDGIKFVPYNLVELTDAPTQVIVALSPRRAGG